MKKITNSIASVLLFGLLAGCGGNGNGDRGTGTGDGLKWETIEVHKVYTHPDLAPILKDSIADYSFKADLKLTFLSDSTGTHGSLADSLNTFLKHRFFSAQLDSGLTPTEAIDKFVALRLDEHKEDIERAKEMGYTPELLGNFVSEISISDTIAYNTNDIISILTYTDEYTGGAHGLETAQAITFDLANETLLTPSMLFKKNSEDQINDLILQKLMAQNDAVAPEELEEMGYFNYAEAKVTRNFLLDDKGITFIFNPYEIAAYFVGTVKITLTYAEISDLIHDDYAFLTK